MRLIKSTAIIGAFTMMSRILGLIRDVLMARFLGAGLVSDALFTAFKLPNLFSRACLRRAPLTPPLSRSMRAV